MTTACFVHAATKKSARATRLNIICIIKGSSGRARVVGRRAGISSLSLLLSNSLSGRTHCIIFRFLVRALASGSECFCPRGNASAAAARASRSVSLRLSLLCVTRSALWMTFFAVCDCCPQQKHKQNKQPAMAGDIIRPKHQPPTTSLRAARTG